MRPGNESSFMCVCVFVCAGVNVCVCVGLQHVIAWGDT